jgi:lysophospholipase L1-like esterase
LADAAAAEKSILVFGDSLSAAYGLARAQGWVALLENRLKRERADYSVANVSISGETSAGGRARIDAALDAVRTRFGDDAVDRASARDARFRRRLSDHRPR